MLYIWYQINLVLKFGKFNYPNRVSHVNTNDNQKFHELTTKE